MIPLGMLGAATPRAVAPPGPVDPDWLSVLSLHHFAGADGATTFTDQKGIAWTHAGLAQIDTAQSKFGGSSLYIPANGRIQTAADDPGYAFGTGDWTVECFIRLAAAPSSFGIIFDSRNGGIEIKPTVYVDSSRRINYFVGGSAVITTAAMLALSTWHHLAVVRSGGTTTVYIDGAAAGTLADSYNYTQARMGWGDSTYSPGSPINGWLDECRVTKGVARYAGAFTPPSAPFPNS